MRKRFYIFIAIGLFLGYAGLIEPNWIKVRTYDLSIEGLPRDITVVHIADVHTRRLGFREQEAIRDISRIDPDYVFMTGDLLKSTSQLKSGLEFLSSLRARRGVYMVPGNADGTLVEAIERGDIPRAFSNGRILMNESVDCGDFTLVGIDDAGTCRDDVAKAFSHVSGPKPILVLTHFAAKTLLGKIGNIGDVYVAMVFSGHTHGGQVGSAPLVGRVPYAHTTTYIAGLYKLDGTYLNVTRGVGTNLFPLRFHCRPEIDVFHLKGK